MGFTLFEKNNGNNRILSKLVVDQSENALQYRLPTAPTAWLFLFLSFRMSFSLKMQYFFKDQMIFFSYKKLIDFFLSEYRSL